MFVPVIKGNYSLYGSNRGDASEKINDKMVYSSPELDLKNRDKLLSQDPPQYSSMPGSTRDLTKRYKERKPFIVNKATKDLQNIFHKIPKPNVVTNVSNAIADIRIMGHCPEGKGTQSKVMLKIDRKRSDKNRRKSLSDPELVKLQQKKKAKSRKSIEERQVWCDKSLNDKKKEMARIDLKWGQKSRFKIFYRISKTPSYINPLASKINPYCQNSKLKRKKSKSFNSLEPAMIEELKRHMNEHGLNFTSSEGEEEGEDIYDHEEKKNVLPLIGEEDKTNNTPSLSNGTLSVLSISNFFNSSLKPICVDDNPTKSGSWQNAAINHEKEKRKKSLLLINLDKLVNRVKNSLTIKGKKSSKVKNYMPIDKQNSEFYKKNGLL
ncbi:unnamed protein product [Gordionus sp. m RMFG-2023]|uniref:uncharacterized protein LOC135925655 n=1 Tax=Gordionus sp. m RMFG-2023 TaxID=3053472 RepID=UPI0030E1CBC1